MTDLIIDLDIRIFLFLNGLHTPWLDICMHWITSKITWFPFYLFIIFIIIKQHGLKGITGILLIVIAIILADQITSGLMKPLFQRLRPCHNPDIAHLVHLVDGCGGAYGFASGHAANSFALSSGLYYIYRSNFRYLGWMFVWAGIVSYSRIYVGVHYPLDIIAGALIGFILGYLLFLPYKIIPQKFRPEII